MRRRLAGVSHQEWPREVCRPEHGDYEKQLATIRLLTELSRGVESLRREGGLTIDEAFEGLGV